MVRVFLIFLLGFELYGCRNIASPSTDPKENTYFRVYNEIYNEWGKFPVDSTKQKLEAYLQEFPENADAQLLAGNINYCKGDYEKAILSYRKAVAIHPNQAIYCSALGTAYMVENKTDSAEKYLLKAIALKDSSLYTYLNTSVLYLKKLDKPKSLAFADSAYAKGNSLPVICSGLSFAFSQWNEKEKSRELLNRAITLGLKDTLAFNEVLAGKTKLEDYYRTHY